MQDSIYPKQSRLAGDWSVLPASVSAVAGGALRAELGTGTEAPGRIILIAKPVPAGAGSFGARAQSAQPQSAPLQVSLRPAELTCLRLLPSRESRHVSCRPREHLSLRRSPLYLPSRAVWAANPISWCTKLLTRSWWNCWKSVRHSISTCSSQTRRLGHRHGLGLHAHRRFRRRGEFFASVPFLLGFQNAYISPHARSKLCATWHTSGTRLGRTDVPAPCLFVTVYSCKKSADVLVQFSMVSLLVKEKVRSIPSVLAYTLQLLPIALH